MDYRRTSLVLSPRDQVHQNAHIYASFAGVAASPSTNGILGSTTMWWDEEHIEATVTRQYVLSKLRPDEQTRLNEPVGFGDGLTDDTYMEWIDQKAKRIFLILVDLGVPDQIFGVIDDSWDDDDLPVPLDQVERLQLTYDKDEKLEKKFFQRQFLYLLRNIQKGDHVYYEDVEVVPLELAEKRPVGAVAGLTQSNVDKVHLPGKPDDVFIRRRIPLGITAGRMPQEEFLSGIEAMKVIEHRHLISLWASYIHQDNGYLLLTPVNDSTLKSFLAVTPQSIKIMAKQDRRILLLNWLHCLADALSFLHSQGLSHRNIKPSNVMLDLDNNIFLSDSGIFPINTLDGEKKGFDKETYDYSAPEMAHRPPTAAPILVPNSRPVSRPSTARRSQTSPISGSIFSAQSMSTMNDTSSIYTTSTFSNGSNSPPNSVLHARKHDPQKSDIFSLGAIFLEILTFILKRASRNFASHRSSKNKTPGRGGGLPDSSFHKNLGQLESWMYMLAKDATKKEDKIFRGVSHILMLVQRMVSQEPEDRPTAAYVQERLYAILTETSGLGPTASGPGKVHCETRKVGDTNQWDFGFDQLRLASQRAAAEACSTVGLNGGNSNTGVIYGVPHSDLNAKSQSDTMSIATRTSNRSSEGKSRSGTGSLKDGTKVKPKAKAWNAPVYAELSFG